MRLVPVAVTALALFVAAPAGAEATADRGDGIVGTWLTGNGEAKIHFAKEGGSYVGRVVWLKTATKDGRPVHDDNNPDPKLRAREMIGAAIVWGMKFDGKDTYTDGHCYDPVGGKTYSGKATLETPTANKLELRGYVGIPLFGRSDTWVRQP